MPIFNLKFLQSNCTCFRNACHLKEQVLSPSLGGPTCQKVGWRCATGPQKPLSCSRTRDPNKLNAKKDSFLPWFRLNRLRQYPIPGHSHPQGLHSFWSAPRIATYGQIFISYSQPIRLGAFHCIYSLIQKTFCFWCVNKMRVDFWKRCLVPDKWTVFFNTCRLKCFENHTLSSSTP